MASVKTLTENPCLKWDVSRGSCQISLLGSRNHLTNHPNTDLNQMERVYWAYAQGLIGHGYGPDSGTEPWPRLRCHRDFKPQLHKHLHRGISLGTCACCTFILFLSDCGGGLVFSNIYILTCLPGCQPPTYTSLSDKERQFPGVLGNLNVTWLLLNVEVLVQIVFWCRCLSYVGVHPKSSLWKQTP